MTNKIHIKTNPEVLKWARDSLVLSKQKAAENIKIKSAKAGGDLVYHNIFSWNVEFYKEETKVLLDLLGCTGKAGYGMQKAGFAESEDLLIERISEAVVNAILRKEKDDNR